MVELADCRSLMFVPAHVPRFVAKAGAAGADALILDLEDSVPADRKPAARAALAGAVAALLDPSRSVLVRINHDDANAAADIAAARGVGAQGLVLPKIDTPSQVARLSVLAGALPLVVQVESALALAHLDAIASAPGVVAMSLGADDFCASTGATPGLESLLLPTQLVLYAARRAGITPLGFAGSISEFRDLGRYRELVAQGRRLGFRGAMCIHPAQVPVLHEEFAPSAAEIEQARAVVAAYGKGVAQGRGAVALDGRMIDAPVVAQARAILARERR
jgi:citrate lyase subunit beta/citryl-CoA lyase